MCLLRQTHTWHVPKHTRYSPTSRVRVLVWLYLCARLCFVRALYACAWMWLMCLFECACSWVLACSSLIVCTCFLVFFLCFPLQSFSPIMITRELRSSHVILFFLFFKPTPIHHQDGILCRMRFCCRVREGIASAARCGASVCVGRCFAERYLLPRKVLKRLFAHYC